LQIYHDYIQTVINYASYSRRTLLPLFFIILCDKGEIRTIFAAHFASTPYFTSVQAANIQTNL